MKITWLKRKYLLRQGEHVNACMPIHNALLFETRFIVLFSRKQSWRYDRKI